MTPKEKAKELFDKFYDVTPLDANINDSVKEANNKILADRNIAKQCALICVDEILKPMKYNDGFNYTTQHLNPQLKKYWQEVKQEIELLKQ